MKFSARFSKTFPLLLAIVVPVVFILVIIGAIYLPARTIQLHNDFVYSTRDAWFPVAAPEMSSSNYSLSKPNQSQEVDNGNYYIYDYRSGQSRKISAQEYGQLNVISRDPTLDGQTIDASNRSLEPIAEIFGNSQKYVYVATNRGHKKLFPINNGVFFNFRGWLP